jgi:hypothetical protein
MTKRLPPMPRAPWHAPASRRASRVSPGLPTLIVCVLGLLPVAVQAGQSVATGQPIAAATVDAPPAPPPIGAAGVAVTPPAPAAAPVTDSTVALDGDGDGGRGDRGGQGRRGGGGGR